MLYFKKHHHKCQCDLEGKTQAYYEGDVEVSLDKTPESVELSSIAAVQITIFQRGHYYHEYIF